MEQLHLAMEIKASTPKQPKTLPKRAERRLKETFLATKQTKNQSWGD
jgi:hypothetical protein